MIDIVDSSDVKKRTSIYTDEELLQYLKQFYKENGRNPMERDFIGNKKYPGFDHYIRHFGNWNKAIYIAGLTSRKGGTRIYTNEELLEYLRKFYEDNGRPPTIRDFKNHKYPDHGIY